MIKVSRIEGFLVSNRTTPLHNLHGYWRTPTVGLTEAPYDRGFGTDNPSPEAGHKFIFSV